MAKKTRKVKILIFEPLVTSLDVDSLNIAYKKDPNITFRYTEPAFMKGGYVPPAGYRRNFNEPQEDTSKDTHAEKVAKSALKGFSSSYGRDYDDYENPVNLEIVLVKHNHYIPDPGATGITYTGVEGYKENVARVKRINAYTKIKSKKPFSEQRIADDFDLQQIIKAMDAESKLGPVSGVNFSFTKNLNEDNIVKAKDGKPFARPKTRNNDFLDNLNVVFTKKRGPWGNVLVSVASLNHKVIGKKFSKDAPGILEDPKSTANRLAKGSSVFNVDNEPVASSKEAVRLSHINTKYLSGDEYQGNSFTSPKLLGNFLGSFARQARRTFPNKASSLFTKYLLKSAIETIRKEHSGKHTVETISNTFDKTIRGNLQRLKPPKKKVLMPYAEFRKLHGIERSIDKSIELEEAREAKERANLPPAPPIYPYYMTETPIERANFDIEDL